MSMICRAGLALALGASLAGCAVMDVSRDPVTTAQLKSGSAVVMISTTNLDDSSCIASATELDLQDAYTHKLIKRLSINYWAFKSDFPDRFSHVYAVALPPGLYAFRIHAANPYATYGDGHVGQGFRLKAGELKYVGDFWLHGCGSVRTGFRNDWQAVSGGFGRVYPGLDLSGVSVDVVKTD